MVREGKKLPTLGLATAPPDPQPPGLPLSALDSPASPGALAAGGGGPESGWLRAGLPRGLMCHLPLLY